MANRPKVVVGDDSALARCIIVQALNDLDVEVVEADSGNGVIRAINQHKPALVLLDISMPYPDGLTVLRKIRSDTEDGRLPVIMCSVENGAMERAEAETLGVSGYMTKPIDVKLLREMVAMIVGVENKKSAKPLFIQL